jgi:hypothetical protein
MRPYWLSGKRIIKKCQLESFPPKKSREKIKAPAILLRKTAKI